MFKIFIEGSTLAGQNMSQPCMNSGCYSDYHSLKFVSVAFTLYIYNLVFTHNLKKTPAQVS